MSRPTPDVTSKSHPLHHNQWGAGCSAWTLMNTEGLSIKQETMPARTEEHLHYHQKAQQFFYILKGEAVFEVDEVIIIVHKEEGIHIEAGRHHRIMEQAFG
jgi:mannose-6-phosphate isomerase-like protein (cupin superfamily)